MRFSANLKLVSICTLLALNSCGGSSGSTLHTPLLGAAAPTTPAASPSQASANSTGKPASTASAISSGASTAAGAGSTVAGAALTADITKMTALLPDVLRQKIVSAFGANMTTQTVMGKSTDFLVTNASLFTGTIGGDATQTIPSKLESPSYFMALATLSGIVGTNYANALTGKGGTAANDCRQEAGAEAIIAALYPPTSAADLKRIGPMVVTACTTDGPATAVEALVSSYATVYNATN